MTFDAVWACARLLLAGQVLHGEGVLGDEKVTATAAGGAALLRDARGRALSIARGLDAYETARAYVGWLGPERAMRSARVREAAPRGRVEWFCKQRG